MPPGVAAAWDRATPRERRLVSIAIVLVVLALVWAVVWRPMVADVNPTRDALIAERARLAAVRAEVDEMVALAKETHAPKATEMRGAVERVLAERALRPAVTALDAKANSVHVVFGAVSFGALIGALDALAKEENLRVVDATLTARVEAGTIRADVTLAR